MSAVISNINPAPNKQTLPWYRYGWPWFLISIPFVSVALGSVMLYLAFQANNSLVVDDYYKQGKAINVRIERDRVASLLGLSAELSSTSEGLLLQVTQSAPEALPPGLDSRSKKLLLHLTWPETLLLRWVHVTQAQRDGQAEMASIGGQRYIAQSAALPTDGKYRLHIQPLNSVLSRPLTERDIAEFDDAGIQDGDGGSTNAVWRLISDLSGFSEASTVSIRSPAPETVFNEALWR